MVIRTNFRLPHLSLCAQLIFRVHAYLHFYTFYRLNKQFTYTNIYYCTSINICAHRTVCVLFLSGFIHRWWWWWWWCPIEICAQKNIGTIINVSKPIDTFILVVLFSLASLIAYPWLLCLFSFFDENFYVHIIVCVLYITYYMDCLFSNQSTSKIGLLYARWNGAQKKIQSSVRT